jgi:hypothetical protein
MKKLLGTALLAIAVWAFTPIAALAQQQVSGVPIENIQPFDPTKPLLQQYCSANQLAAGTHMVEWQPTSGLAWDDPVRVTTPKCWIDCTGQVHCSTACSSAFASGCGGGGSGTVTTFSAGDLSPLFTTSVATPTTTPALSFSLTNTAAFTLFGRNAAGSGAPGYISMDTLFGSCSGPTNAWGWDTTTHAAICNTISGGTPGAAVKKTLTVAAACSVNANQLVHYSTTRGGICPVQDYTEAVDGIAETTVAGGNPVIVDEMGISTCTASGAITKGHFLVDTSTPGAGLCADSGFAYEGQIPNTTYLAGQALAAAGDGDPVSIFLFHPAFKGNKATSGTPGTPIYSFQVNNPLGTFAGLTPASTQGKFYAGRVNTTSATAAPVETQVGSTARGVTGTTDIVVWSDVNQEIDFTNGGAVGEELPTPTTLANPAFGTGFYNENSSGVTVTPDGGWTINGLTSATILIQQTCFLQVDPVVASNWNMPCHDQASTATPTELLYKTSAGPSDGVPGSTVDGVNGQVTLAPLSNPFGNDLLTLMGVPGVPDTYSIRLTGPDGIQMNITGVSGIGTFGLNSNVTSLDASASTVLNSYVNDDGLGSGYLVSYGIKTLAELVGAGGANDSLIGIDISRANYASSGTNIESAGVLIEQGGQSLPVTTLAAIHVEDQNGVSLPATSVNSGILIDSQTPGPNVYGIKSGAGPVDFGDIVSPGILNLADGLAEITTSYIGSVTFTGSGTNDMNNGGTFSGTSNLTYCVQVDGTDTPDTFEWGTDPTCATFTGGTLVPMTGFAQTLSNGVTVTFAATTTHTIGDHWTFLATAALGDGFEFNCADCDTPLTEGVTCTNSGDHAGARALYIRGGAICF